MDTGGYEAGWKAGLLDGRLFVNAAMFDIEWTNLQQLVPQALFSYITNGGRARSQGVEFEVNYRPTRDLTLTGGMTYNNARLVGAQPASIDPLSQTADGDKLANVPDWTASASASYTTDLGRSLHLTTRLDGTYQSSRGSLVTPQNPAYFVIKSYALLDLHLRLDRGTAWQLGLDVDNVLGSFSPLSGRAEDSNLVETITPARPRTILLSLTVRR